MEKQFGIMNKAQLQIQAIKQHLKRKRRSKRAQIKESFYCECGRVYLSFSALYLHAKIKHGTKLTTKQSSNVFTVEKVSGFAKFMYSMKAEKEKECIKECGESIQCQDVCDSKDHNEPEEMGNLRKFLQQNQQLGCYLKILKSEEEKEMLTRFFRYALSKKQLSDSSEKQKINAIPFYLNAFLLDFLPKISEFSIESYEGKQVCQHLYKFCQWMQLNKLTDLLVLTNNGY